MNDFPSIEDFYNNYLAVQSEANERNKATVLDALAQSGITKVTVSFDGAGDSGQIEEMTAFTSSAEISFPVRSILYETVSLSDRSCSGSEMPLREATESLCYDYLSKLYGGWENNDGAFGEFVIDVTARNIELEFNGRYVRHSTETTTL